MPWTLDGPAVEIHADGRVVPLAATSTSTIRLPAGPDGPARLRMFGVDDGMLAHSLPDRAAWGRLVGESPCGLRDRVFTFLDAVRAPFAAPRFVVRPGAAPLEPTCVPARRTGAAWRVQVGRDLADLRLDVVYKDAAVVRLPDGSWLLAAGRYRVRAQDPPRDHFTLQPGGSLGDIVAWRAADPAFREDVRGPFWLVDGRAALPDEAGLAWLGVPGLVVTGAGDEARLDVYYVVEPDEAGGRSYREALVDPSAPLPRDPTGHGQGFGAVNGPPGAPERRGPPDARDAPPERGGPPERGAPPDACGAPAPRPDGPGAPAPPDRLRPGVALKRFAWSDLERLLDRGFPDEAGWEAGGALPGELLGRVRVWMAGESRGEARPIEQAFGGAALRLADPAPLACAARPDLFVAAIFETGPNARRGPPSGHGVWRAAGVPDGAELCDPSDDTCVTTREGLDFLVAPRDRLLATSADAVYGDPDPLRLPFAGVWVAAGDFLLARDSVGLAAVRGTPFDACRPWTAAWR